MMSWLARMMVMKELALGPRGRPELLAVRMCHDNGHAVLVLVGEAIVGIPAATGYIFPLRVGVQLVSLLAGCGDEPHIDGAFHPINDVDVALVFGLDNMRGDVSPLRVDVVDVGVRRFGDM